MLLNATGRQLLTDMCGVEEDVLARALPSWEEGDAKLRAEAGDPVGLWRIGGAVAGPVAFGCRLCTARRTGTAVRAVRYVPPWGRVCGRHGRWLLDADANQALEHLDLRGLPEVVAAQRRWSWVARRAVRAGAEPERVFALAQAVVARWWEQAYGWEREKMWPRRLHQVAGGDAGGDLERWRIVGRDAVVFPEVVAVAGALLDPAMAELVWADSGAGRPRALPADGLFCRRLGERLGRGWLRQEHRAATMAGQLRVLGKEKKASGSGAMWRAAVPVEQRAQISSLVDGAQEQLIQLRAAQTGPSADVARRLLRTLSHSAALIEKALQHTVVAAVNAGVPPQDVAQWAKLPPGPLADALKAYQDASDG